MRRESRDGFGDAVWVPQPAKERQPPPRFGTRVSASCPTKKTPRESKPDGGSKGWRSWFGAAKTTANKQDSEVTDAAACKYRVTGDAFDSTAFDIELEPRGIDASPSPPPRRIPRSTIGSRQGITQGSLLEFTLPLPPQPGSASYVTDSGAMYAVADSAPQPLCPEAEEVIIDAPVGDGPEEKPFGGCTSFTMGLQLKKLVRMLDILGGPSDREAMIQLLGGTTAGSTVAGCSAGGETTSGGRYPTYATALNGCRAATNQLRTRVEELYRLAQEGDPYVKARRAAIDPVEVVATTSTRSEKHIAEKRKKVVREIHNFAAKADEALVAMKQYAWSSSHCATVIQCERKVSNCKKRVVAALGGDAGQLHLSPKADSESTPRPVIPLADFSASAARRQLLTNCTPQKDLAPITPSRLNVLSPMSAAKQSNDPTRGKGKGKDICLSPYSTGCSSWEDGLGVDENAGVGKPGKITEESPLKNWVDGVATPERGGKSMGATTPLPGVRLATSLELDVSTSDNCDEEFRAFMADVLDDVREKDQRIDGHLDRISAGLNRLHSGAVGIQDELRAQERMLDEAADKTETVGVKLRRLDRRVKHAVRLVEQDKLVVYLCCILLLLGIIGYIVYELKIIPGTGSG